MLKKTPPVLAAAIAALFVSGLAAQVLAAPVLATPVLATPVTAASDHPKKKTHASKPVAKPASKPKAPESVLGPRPPGM
jgi:hypothetical protein